MPIKILASAALILASSASAAAPPAKPQSFRVPTKAEMKRCPKLAGIDWKKVRRQTAQRRRGSVGEPADPFERHREIRGSHGLPDLSRAEIALDVAIGAGETQEVPTSTSSIVWKEPGGSWQISRVDYTTWPPPPLPPNSGVTMDSAWQEKAQRPLTEGPLSQSQAEALDKLLANPCFRAQPAAMPASPPMKKGTEQPCYGFIGGTVRMRTPEGVRFISDPCGRGYGYELSSLVMYGTIDSGWWPVRALVKKLGREDIELSDLKRGRKIGTADHLCGSVSAPGHPKQRFTWTRWKNGPYATENLVLESEAWAVAPSSFEQYWKGNCGG
jgi:hypothetical protein